MLVTKVLKNPGAYAARIPLSLAGLFHDWCIRKHKAFGCSFVMPKKHTSHYERGAAWLRGYETPECVLVRKFMPPDASVLELGACIGVVSCVLNKKLINPELHLAIEGNTKIIETLVHNREINGCKFRIDNCVVSEKDYEKFFIAKSIVLSGKNANLGEETIVPGYSIHALEKRHGIKFDFLVMDIEGGEIDILMRNADFLNRCRGIILETHPAIIGTENILQYESLLFTFGFRKLHSLSNVDYFHREPLKP